MGARAVMEAHLAGLLQSKLDFVFFDQSERTGEMKEYCSSRGIITSVFSADALSDGLRRTKEDQDLDWLGLTFDRILGEDVIDAYEGQIFNLHMSLLPMFPGFGATRKALLSGLPFAGVTVHLIDAGVDTGPIISQCRVPIISGDSELELGRRQFDAAVPLLLQTIRNAETGRQLKFVEVDHDLLSFSILFCRRSL